MLVSVCQNGISEGGIGHFVAAKPQIVNLSWKSLRDAHPRQCVGCGWSPASPACAAGGSPDDHPHHNPETMDNMHDDATVTIIDIVRHAWEAWHAAHRAEIASYQGDMTAAKMEAETAGEHYAKAAKIAASAPLTAGVPLEWRGTRRVLAIAEQYRYAAENSALRAKAAVAAITTDEKEKLFLLR